MSDKPYVPKRAGGAPQHSGGRPEERRNTDRPVRKPRARKRRKGGVSPAGLLVAVAMLALAGVFVWFLSQTQLLPGKFLLLFGVVLFLLVVIIGILVVDPGSKARFWSGIVLSVLLTALILVASLAIAKGVGTLNNISGTRVETTHVGIYVNQDDPAQDLVHAADYTFGILGELDRENAEKTIDRLEKELDVTLKVKSYDGSVELVDGLYAGEVGAIIINDAFLDIVEEMEGYGDVHSRLRELTKIKVETVIQQPVQNQNPDEEDVTETPDHVFTMFLSGIDTRSRGLTAKSRSDVNILAIVNTETRQVLLVNTPRDYYVPLSISNGVPDKLTHAGIYGIDVCMDTIGMLYEVDVDYYFRVNFTGFEDIIDSLGGIKVYSERSFYSEHSGYSYDKGYNYLDGSEALGFVRERHAFEDGDAQRGRNQIAVIKAVINKVLSPDILTKFASLMDAVEGSFETSMPYEDIAQLVRDQLDEGGDWNIVTYTVTGEGASKKPYSMSERAYVCVPNESTVREAIELIDRLCEGEILSESN